MDSETTIQDISKDNFSKENMDEKFYTPLCATGYFTPLQRQKLREKRGLLLPISKDVQKEKIPRVLKRKKENNASVPPSKREKRIKNKELVSQLHYSAARIICKTNSNLKEKKFFKASSPSRLEKANFSISFVCKRSLFSEREKNINSSHPKKHPNIKGHSFTFHPSPIDAVYEDVTNVAVPCIIKINSNFSDIAENSIQKNETVQIPEQEFVNLFDFDCNDEILRKRQEEERARAKIKRQKILNETIVDNDVQQNIGDPGKLYYPIFYVASKKQQDNQHDNKRKQKSGLKKFKESSNRGEQMMIDAGQKEFGPKICSTCNMFYSVAVEEDERLHLSYHNTYLVNLKFPGWKEENVIGEYTDGRMIIVRKNEQNFKIKKIQDVLEIVNRDLGFPTSLLPSKPDLTFVLFISNAKQVAGCVVAEPISQAFRAERAYENKSNHSLPPDQKEKTWKIGSWCSSSEIVPVVCGVNRIWVAHNSRRSKVASRMIDCLRCHFVHGHVVGIQELAFTDPSPDGIKFAASYTGTNNFLVYR